MSAKRLRVSCDELLVRQMTITKTSLKDEFHITNAQDFSLKEIGDLIEIFELLQMTNFLDKHENKV